MLFIKALFCNNVLNRFEHLDEYVVINVFIVICDTEVTVISLFWFVETVYNYFFARFIYRKLTTLYDIFNYMY